ncbi:hypothetical protein GCM10023086_76920 [Streptomyces venetus]|uniref:Uncharacterized protein n=1 Tax=Streptomyces venetus TaxID=1701086 RepID=A0ABP8HLF0_9ACTN
MGVGDGSENDLQYFGEVGAGGGGVGVGMAVIVGGDPGGGVRHHGERRVAVGAVTVGGHLRDDAQDGGGAGLAL